MTIIPPAPADLGECGLLRVLRQKSTTHDGLAAKVQEFISVATPVVDQVAAGPFRNFTLHNRDHAKKLIHLAEYVMAPETLAALTPLECTLIIYSAFLHDMGMSITATERDTLLADANYLDSLASSPAISASLQRARELAAAAPPDRKPPLEALIYQLHEAALCAYLRPQHATAARYGALMAALSRTANNPQLFSVQGVSFADILTEICISHNLDAAVLSESRNAYEDRFPRDVVVAHQSANSQFCAAVLRLVDILDFDRERTPPVLFESLGLLGSSIPGADVSLQEWSKHMAVHTLDMRDDELLVAAECRHPAIERAVRDFCQIIEREIKDTVAVLSRNPANIQSKYRIRVPSSVRSRTASVGYTYRDYSMRLNQSAIMALLMGDKLYTSPTVAIRELVQNALDACGVRKLTRELPGYSPRVQVTVLQDETKRTWLEVSDNGIGMDEHVIGEYLLKAGDSYYSSPEFKRCLVSANAPGGEYQPIARFGIGIFSAFMLADALEFDTMSAISPRQDYHPRLVRIERLGGLAFITRSDRHEPGTRVRIRLRPEHESTLGELLDKMVGYLRWVLLRPWFLVHVTLDSNAPFYLPTPDGAFYSLQPAAVADLRAKGYEVAAISLSDWSRRLRGAMFVVFARREDGRLIPARVGPKQVLVGNAGQPNLPFASIIGGFSGNRVTVNGFRLTTFRTRNVLTFPGLTKLAFLLDVDVVGDASIEFHVSRERLTERGERSLRQELRTVALRAVAASSLYQQLAAELQMSIAGSALLKAEWVAPDAVVPHRPDALTELFGAVRALVPQGPWPRGLHHQIAAQLRISASLASRVLGRLLQTGELPPSPAN